MLLEQMLFSTIEVKKKYNMVIIANLSMLTAQKKNNCEHAADCKRLSFTIVGLWITYKYYSK